MLEALLALHPLLNFDKPKPIFDFSFLTQPAIKNARMFRFSMCLHYALLRARESIEIAVRFYTTLILKCCPSSAAYWKWSERGFIAIDS